MQSTKNHQYDGVQALRFLAALLVVITHSFFYATERLGGAAVEWGNGARGVDIFFVISGFVMIISSRNLVGIPRGWAKFAIQRVTRIVPLYWLATSIKVLVMLGAAGLVLHADFDMTNIIKSYFFIPYEKSSGKIEPLLGVGWTLVFEMFFYLVFTMALYLRANVYAFVGIAMLILTGLSLLRPEQPPVWMYLFNSIVLEFLFGMITGYFALKERFFGLYSSVAVIVLTLWLLILVPSYGLPRFVVGIPAALLVYSVVSIEPYLRNRIPNLLLFFGAASYSLYLFHPLFIPVVPVLLHKMHIPIVGLSAALCVASALVIAAFVYQFVELPIIHLFRRLPLISGYSHKPVTEIK